MMTKTEIITYLEQWMMYQHLNEYDKAEEIEATLYSKAGLDMVNDWKIY